MIKPVKIRIEASSYCQLECPACPTKNQTTDSVIKPGFIKRDNFERLLDKNPWLRVAEISNYGEPFLNPDLLEMIIDAHKRNVMLSAQNGVNFNSVKEDVLEAMVKYRFQSLTCSIDGASNSTYRRYRVGGNYAAVIENIRTLNRIKKDYQSRYPYLVWQFIVFGHNEHEIDLARKLAGELKMKFELKLSWDPDFSPVRDKGLITRKLGAASRAEYQRKFGKPYKWQICHQMWHSPQLNWNGDVLGCSRNFWDTYEKNAFKDGLQESINSEKMRSARGMLTGKEAMRADIPCATCRVYEDMLSRGKFLKSRPSFPYRVLWAMQYFRWKHQK